MKKRKCSLLVLLFKKISLRPELSSPPYFRIQGGSPQIYSLESNQGPLSVTEEKDKETAIIVSNIDFRNYILVGGRPTDSFIKPY